MTEAERAESAKLCLPYRSIRKDMGRYQFFLTKIVYFQIVCRDRGGSQEIKPRMQIRIQGVNTPYDCRKYFKRGSE